ncbi:hypothetical protein SAY86_026743 [Trapa natans]|uniref:Uncharacterized protein n=1 Tax=Trapa natans TaxID=22666 RepID=A0AAN7KJ18_TRANT|nr:hypothetical protein SAY86_026743 [Trapa natans]
MSVSEKASIVFLLSLAFFSNLAFSLRDVILLEAEAAKKIEVHGQGNINRPDPLRHLKHYHGGYDIRDKHYWASAAFTGVHGCAVAGVWVLCGAGFGLFLLVKKTRGSSLGRASSIRVTAASNPWILATFSTIILLTLFAIVASSLALAANRSSLHRTNLVKKSIIGAGIDARRTIRKVIRAMTQMQDLLLPFDNREAVELNITTHQLGKESRAIQQFIEKTDYFIDLANRSLYTAHLVVVLADLVLLLAAIVSHFLTRFITGCFRVIIICWVITALYWAITGFDFFFHSFAEDTCSAFGDFVKNPDSSSLSSILPCFNSTYANQVLVQIGSTVYNFVQQINMKVAELLHVLAPNKQIDVLGENFRVCQPFSGPPDYAYTSNCSEGEIQISQVPRILTMLTCYKNQSPEDCARDGKFLSEGAYNITWSISKSISDLLGIYPDLQNLSECYFVKDRLRYVVSHQCRPFRSSIRKLWASMLSLSIFMAALVLLWVAKAYQDRGRPFSICSIFPQS